jgi:protein-S-isoprenylcysteine O-methyltransferase Ste14
MNPPAPPARVADAPDAAQARRVDAQTSWRQLSRRDLLVELVSRAVAVVGLGWFAASALRALATSLDPFVVLVAVDHTLNVVFLALARPPRDVDRRIHVVAITIAITLYTVFLRLEGGHALLPRVPLLAMLFAGLLFELTAKIALGRSFGLVPANRGLVRRGPYRVVRHPIYAGYLVLQASFVLARFSPYNAALYALLLALVVARIVLEERVLARDPSWSDYASRTRYRLVPFVW